MYTVPKLEDYSPEALDSAVAELEAALDHEIKRVTTEEEWKAFRDRWLARKNGIVTQVNELWLKAAPASEARGRPANQSSLIGNEWKVRLRV